MGLPAHKYSIEQILGLRVSKKLTRVERDVRQNESILTQTNFIKHLEDISERVQEIKFDVFLKVTGLTLSELSESLNTSLKTIQRLMKKETVLKKYHLELLLMIARVYERGYEVFEDEEKLKRWMDRPSPALERNRPKDLLKSYSGCQLLLDELGSCRIRSCCLDVRLPDS